MRREARMMEKEMRRIRELSDRLVFEGELSDAEAHELRACAIHVEDMIREERNGEAV